VTAVLDPVGPLPASVYWRRRALALGAVILVLLLGWAVLPGGGDDQPRDTAGALGSPSATVPAAAPTTLSATPPAGDPGRPADGNGGGDPATPTAPVPTAPSPTPAPPPKACADSALRLTVAPRRPAYSVGQSPVLDLRVQNVSAVPCVRDLGAGQQEITLYQGTRRLWSSNDCFPDDSRDAEVLRPGAQETFSVTWSGLGSRPKCAGTRTRIGAGSYALVARLGTLVSRQAPIVLH
jgi:hypothetical protein